MPLSITLMTTSEPVSRAASSIRPPSGVYFAALFKRLERTWASRAGSTSSTTGCWGSERCKLVPVIVKQRPACLDRQLDDAIELDQLFLEDDRSAGDPGNVEQVVDDPGHVLDLFGDDLDRPEQVGAAGPFDSHDLNGVADGRQRVPQFVGEHGEEMVLALVGITKRFLHSFSVVDVGDDRADAQNRAIGSLDGVEAAQPVALGAAVYGRREGDLSVDQALPGRKDVVERLGKTACQGGKGCLESQAEVISHLEPAHLGQGRVDP